MNQTAQNLASYGRNGDSTLVHMSPQEVSGLQALARNHGTTMTINPHTGLPEAFSLGRLLPMIAGFALGPAGLGMSAMNAGLAVGALGTAATGSLKEGLMMGLGAAGGAGLAGSMSNLAPGAVPGAAPLPADALAGAPGVMQGAGTGITVPTNAINAAGPGQLVNPAYMPKVGELTASGLNLPPIDASLANTQSLAGAQNLANTAASPYSLTGNTMSSQGLNAARAPVGLDGNITAAQSKAIYASPDYNPAISANTQFAMKNPIDYSLPSQNSVGLRAYSPQTTLDAKGFPKISAEQAKAIYESPNFNPALSANQQFAMNNRYSLTGAGDTSGLRLSTSQPMSQTAEVASDLNAGYSGTLTPPKDIVSLQGPTMTDRFNRVMAGGEKAFGSMDAAGEFLGSNKMNLAMAAAPALFEEPEDLPEEESYIRPYTLDVENTSDRPASSSGREEQRLRYKYTAGTPYKVAQGGIIAFAQGGNTTDGQELNTNPSMMRRMDEMQVSPFAGIMDPSRMKDIYGMSGQGYAEGGEAREVRKKINRMDDPYIFAAYQTGRGLYDAAMQNFAGGGLANVPRFLSGGGDGMSDSIPASINDRQPARLADGEFVVPADVVSHLGNGSSKAGAKQLYAMMDRVRTKRTGKKKQAPAVNPKKMMPV